MNTIIFAFFKGFYSCMNNLMHKKSYSFTAIAGLVNNIA